MNELCAICDKSFTEEEWAERHSGGEGSLDEIHAHCCYEKGECSRPDPKH